MQKTGTTRHDPAHFDVERALDTIRDLDYIRVCGSDGEQRGMAVVAQRLDETRVRWCYHTFVDEWLEPGDPHLLVGGRKIAVRPALELSFLEGVDFVNVDEQCVGVRATLSTDEGCIGRIAVAHRFVTDAPVHPHAVAQLMACQFDPEMEAYLWAARGCPADRVPTAIVMPQDIAFVLSALGEPAELKWSARIVERTFSNMVAEIQGKEWPDEIIVMGAHMDSWPGTVGASDDAAGCAVLLEAAKWFALHPPARTVRLIWFTGEEVDARGSRTYVRECISDPSAVRLMICVDSGCELGTGPFNAYTSDQSTIDWARHHLDLNGMDSFIARTPGTDARAFIESGIPTFAVEAPNKQSAHLPDDSAENLDPNKLEILGSLSIEAAIQAAHERSR